MRLLKNNFPEEIKVDIWGCPKRKAAPFAFKENVIQ